MTKSSAVIVPCVNICSDAPVRPDLAQRRDAEQHVAHVAHEE